MESFLSSAEPRRQKAKEAADAAVAKGAALARFLGEETSSSNNTELLSTVWQFAMSYDAALGGREGAEAETQTAEAAVCEEGLSERVEIETQLKALVSTQ